MTAKERKLVPLTRKEPKSNIDGSGSYTLHPARLLKRRKAFPRHAGVRNFVATIGGITASDTLQIANARHK